MVEEILPEYEPWIINEALIELGATVCQRKPKCHLCPLATQCLSYSKGTTENFPVKSKGPAVTQLYRTVIILKFEEKYLVKRGAQGAVMADLYEFPFIETSVPQLSETEILQTIKQNYQTDSQIVQQFSSVKHGFTRYKVCLNPYLIAVAQQRTYKNYEWLSLIELKDRPFSSGHRRILQSLLTLFD